MGNLQCGELKLLLVYLEGEAKKSIMIAGYCNLQVEAWELQT